MKHGKSIFRRIVCLFLAAAAAAAVSAPAFAADGETKTVRVGIYVYPKYAEQGESGVWVGYDAEMVENIAQNAGFAAELVPLGSYEEGTAGLADGSIDMLCDMSKTPEREADFLFSEYEQGSTSMVVAVKKSSDAVNYGDISRISALTCAAQSGSIAAERYRDWCGEHGCSPVIRTYETNAGVLASLDSGEADAVILSDDSALGGAYRIVLSFNKTPYYFMFSRSGTELKNRVDTACARIFEQNPLYEQSLKQKYGIVSFTSLALTADEKEYVAAHPGVTVAVVDGDEPYFKTASDGSAEGILPDLYANLSECTGLTFTFRTYASQQEAVGAVLAGQADVLGIYSDGIPYAYHAGLRLTSGYSNVSLVMISRSGTNTQEIRKIAIKKRSANAVKSCLSAQGGNAELIGCESANDCFAALQNGSADALVVALPSATWLINQTNSSAYTFTPLSGAGIELTAAVKYENSTLADILSSGILQSADLFNGIVANNTGSENALQVFVSHIPAGAIVAFASVMIFMVLFLIWAVFSVVKSRKMKIAAVRAEAEAEEQRVRAEAMEKSAEEKNAFFSNISHDMRTPLNGILGFADLAQKQDSLEKTRAYLAKIELSGMLLLNLINDTLTLSKIGNGKLELKPEPVGTDTLAAGITESIQSLALQKGIDFIMDDSGLRHRTVLADKLNIEKIFLNLLSNAVKFTPQGGHVRLTVEDDPKGGKDPDIVATVRDDGIGMSGEYLQHMYEPFSQEKRHGYDSVGTGLGLSIVKQLVELMGGTITAESRVGEGTSFTVRVHLEEVPPDSARKTRSEAPANLLSLRGRRILLCEDNLLNREIAVALLKEKGMTVVSAENGKVGVELFSRSAPGEIAAILMDIRMPVMDGLEAAKAIRTLNRPDARTIPILAMTADAFAEDVQKCLDAGMNGHLAKPINSRELYETLSRFLSGKTAATAEEKQSL